MPDKVLYTAKATSTGDGRNGHVVSSDQRLEAAHQVCPYSRATRGNISVELRVP